MPEHPREVLGEDWLVAELVSVKWKPIRNMVWPTKLSPVPKMEFTTEEFAADVVADVGQAPQDRQAIRLRARVVVERARDLHLSLAEKPIITGAYVAMAVFHPRELPPLKAAKGRAWFIDHSPEDETVRSRMPRPRATR